MSAHVDVRDGRRCHCCGEAIDRCRETYRGTTAPVDLLAVMDASGSLLRLRVAKCNTAANKEVRAGREPHQVLLHKQERAVYLLESHNAARAAMADLIEACANLIHEWDADYSGHGRLDPFEGKYWEKAEARFRAALARVGGAS